MQRVKGLRVDVLGLGLGLGLGVEGVRYNGEELRVQKVKGKTG
jgi:hypothetical protein